MLTAARSRLLKQPIEFHLNFQASPSCVFSVHRASAWQGESTERELMNLHCLPAAIIREQWVKLPTSVVCCRVNNSWLQAPPLAGLNKHLNSNFFGREKTKWNTSAGESWFRRWMNENIHLLQYPVATDWILLQSVATISTLTSSIDTVHRMAMILFHHYLLTGGSALLHLQGASLFWWTWTAKLRHLVAKRYCVLPLFLVCLSPFSPIRGSEVIPHVRCETPFTVPQCNFITRFRDETGTLLETSGSTSGHLRCK